MITKQQYEFLTKGLDPNRVSQKQGQSHLEAWDIRRHLIRVFGYGGFDIERRDLELVKEIETPPSGQGGKTRWTVVYRVELRLIVKDQNGQVLAFFDDGATGDAINQPSVGDAHDFALKTAYSQALKRCAVNLGDQFGLGLYNGGQLAAVVHRSLVTPDGVAVAAPPADATPVQPEPAPVQPEPAPVSEEPVSAPPAQPAPSAPNASQVRDWALDKQRTSAGLQQAAEKLRKEHPAVAATVVVNESGDEEQLAFLMERRARELAPAQPAQANGHTKSDEQRRRERMHALAGEKGLSRDDRLRLMTAAIGRQIASSTELTWPQEVELCITELERYQPLATAGATA